MSGQPTVTVRYWAGARRAAGTAEERLAAGTVAELRTTLCGRPDVGRVAEAASYLVDGQQAQLDTPLTDGSVVDVLPPFAGG